MKGSRPPHENKNLKETNNENPSSGTGEAAGFSRPWNSATVALAGSVSCQRLVSSQEFEASGVGCIGFLVPILGFLGSLTST